MAFQENVNKVYVTIVDGLFAIRSSEADPKAKKRVRKDNSEVWELLFKSYTGTLTEITFRNQDLNGKKWEEMHLHMKDGAENIQIQMPFPSKYANSFLRALPNVDFTAPMKITAWQKIVNDKRKQALFINQPVDSQQSVPWFYTQENPNGLPDLVPYTVPGSSDVKYSDVERNKFFKEMVTNKINPILKQSINYTPVSNTIPDAEEPDDITEPVDDLPF